MPCEQILYSLVKLHKQNFVEQIKCLTGVNRPNSMKTEPESSKSFALAYLGFMHLQAFYSEFVVIIDSCIAII